MQQRRVEPIFEDRTWHVRDKLERTACTLEARLSAPALWRFSRLPCKAEMPEIVSFNGSVEQFARALCRLVAIRRIKDWESAR